MRVFAKINIFFVIICLAACSHAGQGESIHETRLPGQSIEVSVTVPDQSWEIRICKIYEAEECLWVVSRLFRRPGKSGQVISKAVDAVQVKAKDLPVRHLIIGKKWAWKNKESYFFVKDRKTLNKKLNGARLIFNRE